MFPKQIKLRIQSKGLYNQYTSPIPNNCSIGLSITEWGLRRRTQRPQNKHLGEPKSSQVANYINWAFSGKTRNSRILAGEPLAELRVGYGIWLPWTCFKFFTKFGKLVRSSLSYSRGGKLRLAAACSNTPRYMKRYKVYYMRPFLLWDPLMTIWVCDGNARWAGRKELNPWHGQDWSSTPAYKREQLFCFYKLSNTMVLRLKNLRYKIWT